MDSESDTVGNIIQWPTMQNFERGCMDSKSDTVGNIILEVINGQQCRILREAAWTQKVTQ